MSKHIKFDGFQCKNLQYVKPAETWVCLRYLEDLDDVEACFKCKFERQLRREKMLYENH